MIADQHQRIAEFISASSLLVPYALWPQTVTSTYRASYPTAAELIEDEEFRALHLATWLSKPDARLIAGAVGLVIDPASRQEYELILVALRIAAQMQYEEGGPRRAGAGAVALGMISAAVLAAIVPSFRRAAFAASR